MVLAHRGRLFQWVSLITHISYASSFRITTEYRLIRQVLRTIIYLLHYQYSRFLNFCQYLFLIFSKNFCKGFDFPVHRFLNSVLSRLSGQFPTALFSPCPPYIISIADLLYFVKRFRKLFLFFILRFPSVLGGFRVVPIRDCSARTPYLFTFILYHSFGSVSIPFFNFFKEFL